jgi:hypothetical protein
MDLVRVVSGDGLTNRSCLSITRSHNCAVTEGGQQIRKFDDGDSNHKTPSNYRYQYSNGGHRVGLKMLEREDWH